MLTEEEKARIEAEEQYRAEVRAKYVGTPNRKRTKPQDVNTWEDRQKQARRDGNRLAVLIIAAFLVFIFYFAR